MLLPSLIIASAAGGAYILYRGRTSTNNNHSTSHDGSSGDYSWGSDHSHSPDCSADGGDCGGDGGGD